MKKVFKFILTFILFDFIVVSALLGWITFSLIRPSLKGTDITLTDLCKKRLEPEKRKKLESNIYAKSEILGKSTANTIAKFFEKLVPSNDFDYSTLPPVDYPYPSSDEVLKLTEQKANEGIKEGLKQLEQMGN